MPSRVVRGDNLLESGRYMALPDELKVFYVHVLLAADDFGLLSLAPLIVRRLFAKAPTEARVIRLAKALEEVDLVRIFEVDGVFYLFVPRFSQRMKSFRSKCPMPPAELYADDKHATENFNKYRSQFKKLAPSRGEPAEGRGGRRPDLDLDLISISSHLDSEGAPITGGGAEADLAVEAKTQVEKAPNGNGKDLDTRAAALGISQREGEPRNMFMLRVASEEAKARGESRQ